MQISSQNYELTEFKDEILKKIRLIENKFLSEFNSKFSQINSTFNQIDLRINTVSQNNNSLLDLISKQNFHFEKIEQFDIYKSETDKTLLTQKIQIKNVLQDIGHIKQNYEKIITENLIIPGCIGPGSVYKNLADYLVYSMEEFNKLRNETTQNKKKVGDWEKTAIDIISKALFRFQANIENKNNQMYGKFNKKFETFNTKMIDFKTDLEKYQFKIDKLINSMQNDIESIIKEKISGIENINKRMEEFDERINQIIQDIDNYKKSKFNSPKKNKDNIKDSLFSSNKKNQAFNSHKSISLIANNYASSSFLNHIQEKNNNDNKKNSLIIINDEEKDSSMILKNNENNFSQIISDNDSQKGKNSSSQLIHNESKINIEEYNFPILSNKQIQRQNSKNINNIFIQKNIPQIVMDSSKRIDKKNNSHKINNLKIINPIINSNKNGEGFEKEKNKKNIDKSINQANSLQNKILRKEIKNKTTNNIKIKKENKNNVNTDNKRTKKFQINSRNKINGEILFDELTTKEKLLNKNKNSYENIKHSKLNQINSQEKIPKEKIDKNKLIFITNKNISMSQDKGKNSEKKQIKSQEINITELNNKEIINSKPFLDSKKYLTVRQENKISLSKNKKIDLKMNINNEHKKIISKIKEYYNNRKKQFETKSNENVVECNLINLNFKSLSKFNRDSSYSSSRKNSYSNMNKIINFGRTNYKFFSKRERFSRSRSLNNYENENKCNI